LENSWKKDWRSHGRWLDPVLQFYFCCTVICSEWPTFSFTSGDIFDSTLVLSMRTWRFISEPWLSQTNHIFSRLGITSNFEDYGMSKPSLVQFPS
jgi:hypothetical protein